MNDGWVTVYQISMQSTEWFLSSLGVIPLAAGMAILLGNRLFKWRQPHWLTAISLIGCALLWQIIACTAILRDFQALTAYRHGNYQLIEGKVQDFHPMPYQGHQKECFSVQTRPFCYSDYVLAPGFRNTASHGGPIRAGLTVRIACSEGLILRLDIPQEQALSSDKSAAARNSAQRLWPTQREADRFEQRMAVAFLFTTTCSTLWWNLQWKTVMRFWVRPPNRSCVQYLFRVFFALSFLTAMTELIQQVFATHPLAHQELLPTIGITIIMCAAVAIISVFSVWMIRRYDHKQKRSASATETQS